MEKFRARGNLKDFPFPQLLFRIWRGDRSGRLSIKDTDLEKQLPFSKGNIVVERGSFPGKKFLKTLVKKNTLDSVLVEKCESYANQNKCTLLKALHELGCLSPSRIWSLMEDFVRADFFPLFNHPQAEYFFDSTLMPELSETLLAIPTLRFILQGIRQMENYDIIETHIPQKHESIQISPIDYLDQLNLASPERYVLALLDKKGLKNIYDLSELGKKETEKILFSLYSLGVVEFSQKKTKEDPHKKSSPVEADEILDAFNHKFLYVYKFISKELGPVAYNVLEKCLEEIKPSLSSLFQKIKFDSEGRIEKQDILKTHLSFMDNETRRNLIKDLNEILLSEVLAVKKSLGDEHESLLVKNLEKIGEEG